MMKPIFTIFLVVFSSVGIIPVYAIDTFDSGLDGWVYSGTSGYSLSNNSNMAHISGNGFLVNPHAEKTFDVSNADSATLSFDWRPSSGCSCSSTTNFRLMILDTSGNTLSSQTLQADGTTDTGIQSYSADITSTISGHDSIVIRMWLNDSWSSNWNQKIWWDNVDLQVTQSQSDTTAPIITIPNDVTAEATGQSTIVNIGTATATDDIDPNPTITNNSTSSFPVGITAILWTATNSIGNQDVAIQTITVTDTTPPTLIIPNGITAEAMGEHTIVNIGTATVTDNSDPNPAVTNNAPNSFLFGVTYVTWTATDALGNTASSIQTVTIVDTTPPHLTVPNNVTLEYTGQPVTSSIGTATANDLVDSDVTITNDAPNSFLLGTYTITWTATDDSGNQSVETQIVRVQDTTPPIITAPDDMTVEVTGQTTTISIGTATATDSVDASPTITNNATNSFPVGNTIILWTATDDSGNESTATQTITVYSGAVIVEDAASPNPLVKMNEFFENMDGLFFGLGIFTIFFLFIGFMASPKTVHIYTIIIMIFAGILNAMGVFAFPAWMWGVMIFIAIVLVFQRKRS